MSEAKPKRAKATPIELVVEDGIPVPPKPSRANKYDEVFAGLKVGQSFGVSSPQYASSVISDAKKRIPDVMDGLEFATRPDPTGKAPYRVWRTK